MGGQACVFYGAAEFSRDLDLLVLADPSNLDLIRCALDVLEAQNIAVPPFRADFLARGHAVHFRCRRDDLAGLRIDLMSTLRGVACFDELWSRRTVVEVEGIEIDLLSIGDLVSAKKTQRDKDWPMIRRLLERAYFDLSPEPCEDEVEFLLLELRTPELLQELVRRFPELAGRVASRRKAVQEILNSQTAAAVAAIDTEQALERESDRQYWGPLKQELEQLRRSRKSALPESTAPDQNESS